jgi:predicted phage baseplate assembly protein
MSEKECGCCEGIEPVTPQPTANRPGLDALAYRVGTHASFLATMKARLSNICVGPEGEVCEGENGGENGRYPLKALTTRAADDPAIALLDGWATVADVLTFYQERIANEGYLRPATERRSILELARLVGYRLRPGVASSVYLAFTLENDQRTEIPAGTRAQSLPGPDELPQPFETAEALPARAEWNALKPRQKRPQFITPSTAVIYLQGTSTNLKPNAPLLLIDSWGQSHFRRVLRVEADTGANHTAVTLTIKGDVELELSLLTALVEPARIPEEEGPYSVAIADALTVEIARYMADLITVLQHSEQPAFIQLTAVQTYHQLMIQSIRIFKALNFDVIANWATEIEKLLAAIDQQLQARPEARTADRFSLDRTILQELGRLLPSPPAVPATRFSRQIGQHERDQITQTLNRVLANYLSGDDGDSNPATIGHEGWVAIQSAVLRLQQLQFVFSQLRFDELSAWAETMAALLQQLVGRSDVPVKEVAPKLPAFSDLIAPLLLSPSQPPANAWQLQRPFTQVFAPTVDTGPRLLTTVAPALRATLYTAWANLAVEPGPARLFAFRTTAALFGHNVPRQVDYDPETQLPKPPEQWIEWDPAEDERENNLFLDNSYEDILPGSYIAIQQPGDVQPQAYANVGVQSRSRTAYGFTGKTTEITLSGNDEWRQSPGNFATIRNTMVYTQSEPLALAQEPLSHDVAGSQIELDGLYEGLEAGRWLIVSGERTDIPGTAGVFATELLMLTAVTNQLQQIAANGERMIPRPADTPHTTLILAEPMAYHYKRESVTIYGNVIKATHGETRREVLGSGDGGRAWQQFVLKKPPLTYLSASNPSGAESTLTVRVNDVRWQEADNHFVLTPHDRSYTIEQDNEGKTTITFGNGRYGSRLPSGEENVTAVYRSGIGREGNVNAEQISLLATRPLGVKEVINPQPATGGASAESRDQARRNAPLAVMALDRLVSMQDYADFARTFAGIGKASATRLSDGQRQLVHLTIAGAEDIPIAESSDLYRNLRHALHLASGDPHLPLQLAVRELLLLVIVAGVRIHPDYLWEKVAPRIRQALFDTFSFERRDLGQDVTLSEVISTMQRVPGVIYVDVDLLQTIGESDIVDPDRLADKLEKLATGDPDTVPPARIRVALARHDDRGRRTKDGVGPRSSVLGPSILPAQLAYLSPHVPDTLLLREISHD